MRRGRHPHGARSPVLLAVPVAVAGCAIQPDRLAARHPGGATRSSFGTEPAHRRRRRRARSLIFLLAPARTGPTTAAALGDARRRSGAHGGRYERCSTARTPRRSAAISARRSRPTSSCTRRPREPGERAIVDVERRAGSSSTPSTCAPPLAQIVFTATASRRRRRGARSASTARTGQWPRGDGALTDRAADAVRLPRPGRVDAAAVPRRCRRRPLSLSTLDRTTTRLRRRTARRRPRYSVTSTGRVLPTAVGERLALDAIAAEHRPSYPTPGRGPRRSRPTPYRVDSTRSYAVGVPPRWTWPSCTTRASKPVRSPIASAMRVATPPSTHVPELVVRFRLHLERAGLRLGTLGDDDDRGVAAAFVTRLSRRRARRCRTAISGMSTAVGAAGDAGVGGDPARVAAHHLDDHHPVVALGGGVQAGRSRRWRSARRC